MKKILLFVAAYCMCIGWADAAVRDASSINRNQNATITNNNSNTVSARTTQRTQSGAKTSAPRNTGNTVNRQSGSVARGATQSQTVVRSGTSRTQSQSPRSATPTKSVVRSASTPRKTITPSARNTARTARSATITNVASNTFGTGYNACRDAYFTCMDQFCATMDTSYRRCICSSRLTDIKSRERALSQTTNQLQDFKDLNIEVIPKTAAEVKAMLSATEGESTAATTKDTSSSAQKLAGISEVLSNTKAKSLSTQGTLDIAGDINAIWATTDLTSGASIANLTGESLYNAVHAQCAELVSSSCSSTATFNMVVSAYGMYIENDCTTLSNALDKQATNANSAIRDTEREMNLARLENYDAHNSTSINDCIAQVRKDITADTACGTDYVHCLDISGRYLNRDTGEPIYTADFYQLENQISLSGDILNNQSNRMIVAELNRKREYAARGLETCRDLADEVWDEFMRQAITEIYQGQQERIRQVKNDCLDVVNKCYDEQSASLKDFSNVKEQLLLGSRLELSEEMCKEKLDACSNLYGGGSQGLSALINAMHNITDQKIAKECRTALEEYAQDMCSVPSNDTLHTYPFSCRVYAPGEQQYATIAQCNEWLWTGNSGAGGGSGGGTDPSEPTTGYSCPDKKTYISCKAGYYMTNSDGVSISTPEAGNKCLPCPAGSTCAGGVSAPIGGDAVDCGDYTGSLYQKLVRYALQACVRPSTSESNILPATVLQDVNMVMDSIRVEMATVLSTECDRLGGTWIDSQWVDETIQEPSTTRTSGADGIHDITNHKLFKRFYNETSANTKWGYCATPEETTDDTTSGDTTTTTP